MQHKPNIKKYYQEINPFQTSIINFITVTLQSMDFKISEVLSDRERHLDIK